MCRRRNANHESRCPNSFQHRSRTAGTVVLAAVDCKEHTSNFTKIFETCNLLESVKNQQNLHNRKVVFAGDSKVYHLLAGIGNDASTYGCVYCFVKTRTVSITNAAGDDRRVRHSTMESVNSEYGATDRNYDYAVLGFGTYTFAVTLSVSVSIKFGSNLTNMLMTLSFRLQCGRF